MSRMCAGYPKRHDRWDASGLIGLGLKEPLLAYGVLKGRYDLALVTRY